VELTFAEEHFRNANVSASGPTVTRSKIHVVIRPRRARDRRQGGAVARARQLLFSIKSYLMATDDAADDGVFRRATHMVVPWLSNKEDMR
jgi:hypothetical protein